MKKKRLLCAFLIFLAVILGLWLLLELGVRWYVESPLETDFYSSIPRHLIPDRQQRYGLQTANGSGWIHLGWIADPEREEYRVDMRVDGDWQTVDRVEFGSFLYHGAGGEFRVWREPKDGSPPVLLGEAAAVNGESASPVLIPRIAGAWQILFRPGRSGYYINDHTVFPDVQGNWHLIGITSRTGGDFNAEVYFAVGMGEDFPPPDGMREGNPVADFGDLAWAPHVLIQDEQYYMFWSPHRLHQMTSPDGIHWEDHRISMPAPYHKFFRDPMVIQVTGNQWLLYTTARAAYYSQVDIYQSFDLEEWQYIGSALRSGWGSERNSPFGSMESPFVIQYQGHYYLSLTYNNDSFFWPGILLMFQIWPDAASYNETLVFHSDNPYDFGIYRGRRNSPSLLTSLEAHAPEYIYNPDTGGWYITTAGWPWVATLTTGEVAVARLTWEPVP